MREHLLRTRQVEAAIRTELLRRNQDAEKSPAHRVLLDLIDARIATLDDMIAKLAGEAETPFYAAMDRIRAHFDKASETPYKSWRGPTPVNQPSLAKDIVTVFEELTARGVWMGPCPVLDPRWNPLPEEVVKSA